MSCFSLGKCFHMRIKESQGPSVKTLQLNMELCHFCQTKYDHIYKKKSYLFLRFSVAFSLAATNYASDNRCSSSLSLFNINIKCRPLPISKKCSHKHGGMGVVVGNGIFFFFWVGGGSQWLHLTDSRISGSHNQFISHHPQPQPTHSGGVEHPLAAASKQTDQI